MKLRVLFLCETNGIQSPIAEALLNGLDSEHFAAISAGTERAEMHPLTVEVMREIGIDLAGRATKGMDEVLGLAFDFVITLSERARTECPKFPEGELVHWQFDDPLMVSGRSRQKRMFESLRDQIAQRVRLFALVQTRSAAREAGPDEGDSKRHLVQSGSR